MTFCESNMNFRVRAVEVSDVDDLFGIRCSVVENHQSREELAQLGITPKTVAEMIGSGDFVSFLAEQDKRPVGFTMANITEGYVFACFMLPSHEKQGIGRVLMERTEQGLASRGVRKAWLSTGPGENLRAVGFYRRLGWKQNGFLDDGQMRFEKEVEA